MWGGGSTGDRGEGWGVDRQLLRGSAGRTNRDPCAVGMGKYRGRGAGARQKEKCGMLSCGCCSHARP